VIVRPLLAAAVLTAIVLMAQWQVTSQAPPAEQGKATRPGYFLTGVDLEEFGVDGKLRIGLRSISATEDPASGLVRLSDVAVDYHSPTGRLWHLTANEAHVPPGGRTVEFEGDVRLAGEPGETTGVAELHTARLALDTLAEIADTRAPVELAIGAHRVRALGMRADLKAGTLRLESDVNGRFSP
jgi:LPS export ABC transporter protein LptC